MVSEKYVQNIFDRSITELSSNGEFYILRATLPNGYTIAIANEDVSKCTRLVKDKIYELESYLERDKVYYGYDLESEYE